MGLFSFGKSESKPTDRQAKEFKELRQPFADVLSSYLVPSDGSSNVPGPRYEGPFVAPITENEQGIVNQLGAQPFYTENDLASQAELGKTIRGEYLDPRTNPFLQGAIEAATRPIQEAFDEQELMDRALFSRSGQKIQESSPFSEARGIATRGYLNAIGDVTSNIAFGNYQAERANQQDATTRAAQLDQATLQRGLDRLQGVALPRLISDMGLERGREEFNRRVATLLEVLRLTGAATAPAMASSSKAMNFGIL